MKWSALVSMLVVTPAFAQSVEPSPQTPEMQKWHHENCVPTILRVYLVCLDAEQKMLQSGSEINQGTCKAAFGLAKTSCSRGDWDAMFVEQDAHAKTSVATKIFSDVVLGACFSMMSSSRIYADDSDDEARGRCFAMGRLAGASFVAKYATPRASEGLALGDGRPDVSVAAVAR